MKITAQLIREVREETGAPMARTKQVLEEVAGDRKKAGAILTKEGFAKMEKRADRETSSGTIAVYKHHTGKVAVMVTLLCETDFVAKNEMFVSLGNDIAMQVASMNPKTADELLAQDFIKDPSKKMHDLVKEVITKTGENIRLGDFVRYEL
ncbi:elongation factor Ts [Candidatus Microgenomates bacterium]|nr:MAG: elongation factor Ts [Candidatus Microgenomates bacterium]